MPLDRGDFNESIFLELGRPAQVTPVRSSVFYSDELDQTIQPTAGMDIKELKERFGHGITLWGGVSNENLIMGTPADVESDARYAYRWAAPGGGYIMGASHSLAVGIPLENLMTMKRFRDEHGVYPISGDL